MADLIAETNYLNPDVEVIAEINTLASFDMQDIVNGNQDHRTVLSIKPTKY
jgi:hypothetical protein